MELTERQKQILFATVKTYISTGEPVGSKILCQVMPIKVSSATVRAVLSDLCEMGFLNQPHTSAGRVPSAAGYRFFIEQLLDNRLLNVEDKQRIDGIIGSISGSPEAILESACELLATLTGCAAMVTTPHGKDATVKSIQFIKIMPRTIMIVAVTSNGTIKNRVARLEHDITADQLNMVYTATSTVLINKKLEDVSIALSQDIICKLGLDMLLLAPIVSTAIETVISAFESELKLKGEANLLIHSGFTGDRAARIVNYLQNHSSVMNMLKNQHNNITVVLGGETNEDALTESGVIISHYKMADNSMGSIGVLGPERMNYEKIIPAIMYFSDSLGRLLSDGAFEDMNF